MNIKSSLSSFLLLITLFSSSIAFAEDALLGYWLSTTKSKGDMASILEFRNDGTVAHTMSIVRDYHYSVSGNILTIGPVEKTDAGETILYVSFNNNELTLKKSENDNGLNLKRMKGTDENGNQEIIGQWFREKQESKGMIEHYIFTKEGVMRYRLPMPGSTVSNYKMKGNTLEMSRKDIEPTITRWHIKDGHLTLSSDNGKEWTYKRPQSQQDTTAQQHTPVDRLDSGGN